MSNRWIHRCVDYGFLFIWNSMSSAATKTKNFSVFLDFLKKLQVVSKSSLNFNGGGGQNFKDIKMVKFCCNFLLMILLFLCL